MILIKSIKDLDKQLLTLKKGHKKKGFIPTMGALHQGHISLLEKCKREGMYTICSIFVNPTQFNNREDFENYPATIGQDLELLHDSGCDLLFLPDVKEMYPGGFQNRHKLDFGFLAETLEGEFRPGHFEGMVQIVEKLLEAIKPELLFMGQKDYQQQLICRALIRKRKFKTSLVTCPIVREADGLAMSSRNVRLSPDSRKDAVEIFKTMKVVKKRFRALHQLGEINREELLKLENFGFKRLKKIADSKTEYFAIRDAENLKPPGVGNRNVICLAAIWVGGVRLIDNLIL